MKIGGRDTRTIVVSEDGRAVDALDQTRLPFEVAWKRLETLDDAVRAISTMVVRGAPLIGVTGAYGLWLAMAADPSDASLSHAREALVAARPTAVNLAWAVGRAGDAIASVAVGERAAVAAIVAGELADDDVATNLAIGAFGRELLEGLWEQIGRARPLRVLTHCNAGCLATVDGGTALAPIYAAAASGIDVHVIVDETRPRNQGASLTAFELREAGIALTVVADNASGHLLQRGEVDVVIVGADRVARNGDVANKIGTYLKALASQDSDVPFFVACPVSTIDVSVADGIADIPIERRSPREVTHVRGRLPDGTIAEVQIVQDGVEADNPAFDVTPGGLVTALVTELGVFSATSEGIDELFATLAGLEEGGS